MSRASVAACAPWLLALLATTATSLAAQRVERRGQGDPALDRRLEQLIDAGNFLLITRDTTIEEDDTVRTTILAVRTTVAVEGVILGDLVGVNSNVFVRPTARIRGETVNISGGLYRSELARLEGGAIDSPLAPYRVAVSAERVRIIGGVRRPALDLDNVAGFHEPSYDRVDGVTLEWGGGILWPALLEAEPRLGGWLGYRSDRGELTGGLELRFERRRTTLTIGAEETTFTNDAWVRGDLMNSLAYLWGRRDYRNYYESERSYLELARRYGRAPLVWELTLRAQRERAFSLRAGSPWSFSDDDARPNPAVDEGRIASIALELAANWEGPTSQLELAATLERAGKTMDGDFEFTRYGIGGEWAMRALANHTLEVEWRFAGPLPGTDNLPRQRWHIVGGSSTLQTFEIGDFRGDRLAFVESKYWIPLGRRVRLPLLGSPKLGLLHTVGMAWTRSVEPGLTPSEATPRRDLEQNVGLRLQFFGLFARFMLNPADTDDTDFDLSISWPVGGYAWERE